MYNSYFYLSIMPINYLGIFYSYLSDMPLIKRVPFAGTVAIFLIVYNSVYFKAVDDPLCFKVVRDVEIISYYIFLL